jgi:hypothetical protein
VQEESDEDYISKVIFSDKETFSTSGIANRQQA